MVDLVVAGSTQRHEVFPGVSTALGDWCLVMHLCRRGHLPDLDTLLTQRVLADVSVPDAFPCTAIFAVHVSSTLILVILAACYSGMIGTVLSVCQIGAARVGAGSLGFSWHGYPPSAVVPGSCSE